MNLKNSGFATRHKTQGTKKIQNPNPKFQETRHNKQGTRKYQIPKRQDTSLTHPTTSIPHYLSHQPLPITNS
jgi:hypothetical protein